MESIARDPIQPADSSSPAASGGRPDAISERFISDVCARLAGNLRLRRMLPVWGRVHIDRQLPFLCVYRRRRGKEDAGTEKLVMGEASYLVATDRADLQRGLGLLIKNIVRTQVKNFGAFLLLEIWEGSQVPGRSGIRAPRPAFRVIASPRSPLGSTVAALETALGRIRIRGERARVEVASVRSCSPEGLPRLMSDETAASLGCHLLGIEVSPIYRDAERHLNFPIILRTLHRRFSRALQMGLFEFVQSRTTQRPKHYLALGRRSFVKAVFEVDRELARISNDLDFLLAVSPTNVEAAWDEFRRLRFEREPEFIYRRLPLDPSLMKRRLFSIPIDRIEDPALAQVFHDQQIEFDRKLTMLMDRGSRSFLYGSLQLFGGVEPPLLSLSKAMLRRISPKSRDRFTRRGLDARAFAARAEREIEHYRSMHAKVFSRVEVRDDLSGVMVSHGNVLVGSDVRIPPSRVEALLCHEVGTHVLTYFNGRAQPFKQLYVGLPGYEELQEGLAVLGEYLVGGLSRSRLRLLAARVLGADSLVRGATFVDLFRVLHREHGFPRRAAFTVTMRIFRGGGLTKDAIYLRGLQDALNYFRKGGSEDLLYVGKFGLKHVPFIEEMRWRQILKPAPLRPRFLDGAAADRRIDRLRRTTSVMDLLERN